MCTLVHMTSVSASARPAKTLSRARVATAVLFLTNGALFANLLPRYPEIKAALGLDNTLYGLAVIAFPLGAIVAGLAAASLLRRFGAGNLAVAGTVLTSIGLLGAGFAPSVLLFAGALFFAGAMDSITDVAQNAHGLRVQRLYGRSIINSFHAIWSVGAVLGGSMSAVAIALGVPLGVHLTISAVLFASIALIASRYCLPGTDEVSPGAGPDGPDGNLDRSALPAGVSRLRITLILGALVLIAMMGTTVEDAGNSWATLYLSADLGAPAALAATGFIALVGAQFIGRLIGDRLVDRFGQVLVARAGGVIVVVGMGLALLLPTVPGTIAGFAAAGFGIATLVPAAMTEADELPGLRPGTGLTIVSWLMRLGFLLSPPIIGVAADNFGLRLALCAVPLAGVLVIVFAGALRPRLLTKAKPAAPSA